MANALLDIPGSVKKGEAFTVRAVLSHIMETGYRRDISGKIIRRNIITRFMCTYAGEEVIRCDLTPAVAANPLLSFDVRAEISGLLVLAWVDDEGQTYREEVAIKVLA